MFEYKVVPAPTRGLKAKGVKGTPDRFANALETVMNELGAQGWEYQRTDTLPVEERKGLTGKSKSFQNMLVFRRSLVAKTATQQQPVAAVRQAPKGGSAQGKKGIAPQFTAPKKTATQAPQTKVAPPLAAPAATPDAGNASSTSRETSSRARTSRTTDPVVMKR